MVSVPYAFLWLFVFSLPWQGIIRIGNMAVVGRLLGAVALACALLAVVVNGRFRRWHLFHVSALLFVIWCAFGLFYHGMAQVPLKFWTFVQLLAVVWMIWELAPSAPRVRGLLAAYLLGSYVVAIQTVLLLRSGQALHRFAAGNVDPNDLAMMMALALPTGWYLGITTPRPVCRWIARGYLVVGLLAVILTGSRGAMVTALFGLLIVPLTMTKLSPGKAAAAIALLAIAGALTVTYVPDRIVQRLETTGSEVEDASLGGRFTLWHAGANAFLRQPLLGYGTSGFISAIKPKMGPRAQVAHNSFLSLLVETGLIGFLLYTTMMVTVLLSVRRLPPLERRYGVVLFITLCVAMSPLTWEDVKAVWFTFAALLGLAYAYDLRSGSVYAGREPRGATLPAGRRPATRPQRAGIAEVRGFRATPGV